MAPKRSKKTSTSFSSSKHNNQFVVEAIVNKRITIDGKIEYLLKWEGHLEDEKSWEPETNLNCSGLIEKLNKFQKLMKTATSSEPVEEIIGVTHMDSEVELR
uniref:Chromo domain-containing protein n=1 Tax=Meloidogyne floridensis TaxID=298350 RepID=A0A915PF23_9BILA